MINNNFDKNTLQIFGWNDLCNGGDCKHCDTRVHSHSFRVGKQIMKVCEKCKVTLEPHSQTYDILFGGNRVIFFNSYNCRCGYSTEEVLYDEAHAFPSEMMRQVRINVEHITSIIRE